ncbi:protein farnesyltransferase subunit beta [Bacillus rossius redtenbacheri]|uniref:protein farnesyltransferase subunit beta n=1 Tax=Bacillus rossius redtenbacheri TaxID=93214 RepID=UPI002FDEA90C
MEDLESENIRVIIRSYESILKERFNDEDFPTITSHEQLKVERTVDHCYSLFSERLKVDLEAPTLNRYMHEMYLKVSLSSLPTSLQSYDASRPWLCYWIVHSLQLLNQPLSPGDSSIVAQFLARCQSPEGGFGGGPGQIPHLASTYAAVNALCSLSTEEAFRVINRETLERFLWSVRRPDGSFAVHVGGEVDLRGVYCAAAVAKLTGTFSEALFDGSAYWIVRCQTYEGGFSSTPGSEAHGGYVFCGIAALLLLEKQHMCDLKALLRWLVNRQMRFEGGFQGRTNKLVDSCYSFWQGCSLALVHQILASEDPLTVNTDRWLFHQEALQEYILVCCQAPKGGLLDKPDKRPDAYHTCYSLSGLSLAQHPKTGSSIVVGERNELVLIHPVFNITQNAALLASRYFYNLSSAQS